MTRLHVLRVTEEELIKIQDAIDDAFSPGIERRSAEAHARLALRLHDLTGEELDPDVEQFCSAFMPGNTAPASQTDRSGNGDQKDICRKPTHRHIATTRADRGLPQFLADIARAIAELPGGVAILEDAAGSALLRTQGDE